MHLCALRIVVILEFEKMAKWLDVLLFQITTIH